MTKTRRQQFSELAAGFWGFIQVRDYMYLVYS